MKFVSAFKPAWHIDRIADLRAGRNIVPIHLHFIISDLCNQNCHFCAYRMDGGQSTELFAENGIRNPNRFMPTEKAIEILDDFHAMGGKAVQFTGGGEPTVHKDHIEIIGHAQETGLQTALVTNGVKLTDHKVFRNLDWLRISLDAGTANTYTKIRQSTAWKEVMENLKLVGTFKKPITGVGFVVTRDNHTEMQKAADITRRAGIRYMRVSGVFSDKTFDEYYRGVDVKVPDDPIIVNNFDLRKADLDQGSPDYEFCGYQQFTLYIGGDLNVYRCCTTSYTTHGLLGSLREQTFRQFLIGNDRRDFDARTCHHCQFNQQNRLINYLLEEAPEHVDFT